MTEVQLSRKPEKRRSCPVYVATLHARLGCPTALLVLCPDPSVASWYDRPIEVGPGNRVTPLVLGPDQIPITTDLADVADTPELAVLSALAHGAHPEHRAVLDVLIQALAHLDPDRADLYAELVLAALPPAAHDHLEAPMTADTFEYQSRCAQKLLARGKTEGKATDVLMVLDTRDAIPSDVRTRITACTDLDQLESWLRRAVTADSAHDLFE